MLKVWTFVVSGGKSFTLEVKGNPPLQHDGGRTLWKLVASTGVALEAAMTLHDKGCVVDVHTEQQTAEQFMERSGQMPLYVFKCTSCDHKFERQMSMADPNPPCPRDTTEEADETPAVCGSLTEKVVVPGGTFHLKGSGWAKDGYGG